MNHNIHHFYWQNKSYKNSIERTFREHRFNKASMYVPIHNNLHAELAPPPKPTKQQMLGVLAMFHTYNNISPLDSLVIQAEYFAPRNDRISTHLLQQLGYVAEGLYDNKNKR